MCFSGWLQHNVLGSKRGYIRLPSEWWVDNTFLFLGNFLHIFHFYPLHFKHIRPCISNSERWGCLQIFIQRVQFGICAQLHLTAVDTCILNLAPLALSRLSKLQDTCNSPCNCLSILGDTAHKVSQRRHFIGFSVCLSHFFPNLYLIYIKLYASHALPESFQCPVLIGMALYRGP